MLKFVKNIKSRSLVIIFEQNNSQQRILSREKRRVEKWGLNFDPKIFACQVLKFSQAGTRLDNFAFSWEKRKFGLICFAVAMEKEGMKAVCPWKQREKSMITRQGKSLVVAP